MDNAQDSFVSPQDTIMTSSPKPTPSVDTYEILPVKRVSTIHLRSVSRQRSASGKFIRSRSNTGQTQVRFVEECRAPPGESFNESPISGKGNGDLPKFSFDETCDLTLEQYKSRDALLPSKTDQNSLPMQEEIVNSRRPALKTSKVHSDIDSPNSDLKAPTLTGPCTRSRMSQTISIPSSVHKIREGRKSSIMAGYEPKKYDRSSQLVIVAPQHLHESASLSTDASSTAVESSRLTIAKILFGFGWFFPPLWLVGGLLPNQAPPAAASPVPISQEKASAKLRQKLTVWKLANAAMFSVAMLVGLSIALVLMIRHNKLKDHITTVQTGSTA